METRPPDVKPFNERAGCAMTILLSALILAVLILAWMWAQTATRQSGREIEQGTPGPVVTGYQNARMIQEIGWCHEPPTAEGRGCLPVDCSPEWGCDPRVDY